MMSRHPHSQLALNLEPRQTYAREDFFTGSSNQHAVQSIIEAWPCWPSHGQILVGPSGSGKTHLASIWQGMSQAIFLNTCHCLQEIQTHIGKHTQNPVTFVLDDFPDPRFQEQDVFHLYNLVQEHQGALLILSQTLPQEWSLTLSDLKSRLFSLPLQTLADPDDDMLRAVLRKHFSDFQMRVPESILSYVLPRIERSFKAAYHFAQKLNAETIARKKNVTLNLARMCLDT